MKTKFSYYSLRFPDRIASLCLRIQENLCASYIDLPFLLPLESKLCEYRECETIIFENREYFAANGKMDVCFKSKRALREKLFGVINVTESVPEYVLWTTFYNEELKALLAEWTEDEKIRVYPNPARCSVTIKCHDLSSF